MHEGVSRPYLLEAFVGIVVFCLIGGWTLFCNRIQCLRAGDILCPMCGCPKSRVSCPRCGLLSTGDDAKRWATSSIAAFVFEHVEVEELYPFAT